MTSTKPFTRRRFIGAIGASLLVASVDDPLGIAAPTSSPRALLVRSKSGSKAAAVDDFLGAALTKAGVTVGLITYDDLLKGDGLTSASTDVVVVPDAPRLPIECGGVLAKFAGLGGQLALLGGVACSEPLLRVGSEWLDAAQWLDVLRALPFDQTVLAVPSAGAGSWTRNAANRTSASAVTRDTSDPARPSLRFDLRDVGAWKWDFFTTAIQPAVSPECNAISFWAKGDRATPNCSLEIHVPGQETWRHTVELETEWTRHVVPLADFHADSKAEEQLSLGKAVSISFGVATGGATFTSNDHTFWISNVSAGHYAGQFPSAADSPVAFSLPAGSEMVLMDDIRSVVACAGQELASTRHECTGRFKGVSAVGFTLLWKSTYVPLLSGRDSYNRHLGWAAGVTTHYDGSYKGSNWFLAGIESPDYYQTPQFADLLVSAVRAMCSGALLSSARSAALAQQQTAIPLVTPAPRSFVRIEKEAARFIDQAGAPLFFTGTNYLGYSWRLRAEDFKRAHDAGINFFRIWLGVDDPNPAMTDAIRECARRYGIYLLLHVGGMQRDGDAMAERSARIAKVWRDEPMVVGYDLCNEPEITNVGAIEFGGQPSPVLRLKPYDKYANLIDQKAADSAAHDRKQWPPLAKWATEDDAKHLYAANQLWGRFAKAYTADGTSTTTLPGVDGPLVFPADLMEPLSAINASFALWIDSQCTAIRANDPNHFITVGYNTLYSCLPCNKNLDFVSQHVYQAPASLAAQRINSTALDRLAKVWPAQPMMLGEFGYTNGALIDGKPLDIHASAVGEMIVYLTALAHGHSGCAKWMLNDIPVAVYADSDPWLSPSSRVAEGGFGIYAYDGSPVGRAKPIAHALRALRGYLDGGGHGGDIVTVEADGVVGYVYRAKDAIFLGGKSGGVDGLSFRSVTGHPIDVALYRTANGACLSADSDALVDLDPEAMRAYVGPSSRVSGRYATASRSGGRLTISLLAGERVTIG
ncbi:MAG: hypothetical protein P4L33_08625 [Capsulimonadaceae bacterium]|nr:hypothetical protein [Capsulimonadaceae bacterium]